MHRSSQRQRSANLLPNGGEDWARISMNRKMAATSSESGATASTDDGARNAGDAAPSRRLRHIESDHIKTPSPLRIVLTDARADLWNAQPLLFYRIFNALRDYAFDPVLALAIAVLPPLLKNKPIWNKLLALCFKLAFFPLRKLYCRKPLPEESQVGGVRSSSRDVFLRPRSTVKAKHKAPKHKPPTSESEASYRNAVSFAVSAVGDIVGVLTNPKKMNTWFDAFAHLKAFLDASGVGDDLEEGLVKPLLRFRLLDNLKILNDIQEEQDVDRHMKSKHEGDGATDIKKEVEEGHRLMRFATAAYGVEMIKGAVDFEVDPERLKTHKEAIAVHTGIDLDDIRYLYTKDDDNMHILQHFASVDRKTKSIILALRGTLSLSGAIIDMQGFSRDFCLGLAHHGMAKMAEDIWEISGNEIKQLLEDDEFKDWPLVITGHSLGAGVACLLNIMCHVDKLVGDRKVKCYGFAPPPTYFPCNPDATGDGIPDPPELVKQAIQNCTGYIHDNDVVPFASIASIRKLALILDTVDNSTEHMWFYDRWKIYHEYKAIPREIYDAVAEAAAKRENHSVDGECNMIIPAQSVIWMKKNVLNDKFTGYGCDPSLIAEGTVFVSPDMISDHLCEMYEDALDALIEDNKK